MEFLIAAGTAGAGYYLSGNGDVSNNYVQRPHSSRIQNQRSKVTKKKNKKKYQYCSF